jgi:hypothetical protein
MNCRFRRSDLGGGRVVHASQVRPRRPDRPIGPRQRGILFPNRIGGRRCGCADPGVPRSPLRAEPEHRRRHSRDGISLDPRRCSGLRAAAAGRSRTVLSILGAQTLCDLESWTSQRICVTDSARQRPRASDDSASSDTRETRPRTAGRVLGQHRRKVSQARVHIKHGRQRADRELACRDAIACGPKSCDLRQGRVCW